MSTLQICAYNQARECFLGLHVTAADLSGARLHERIDTLALRADECLWLTPFRGLPQCGQVAHDLIFLDSELRVVKGIESWVGSNSHGRFPEAASLLIVSSNSIYSSNTQPGDQLLLCAAEELTQRMEERLAPGTAEAARVSQTPEASASQLKAQELAVEQSREEWLEEDRRRAPREPGDGLAAYFWYGSSPESRAIRDISATGLYLITAERWYPGTLVKMALQTQGAQGESADQTIAVQSCVMRWGKDGVGLQFVASDSSERLASPIGNAPVADPQKLRHFLDQIRRKGHGRPAK
jgi:hypothetical protein